MNERLTHIQLLLQASAALLIDMQALQQAADARVVAKTEHDLFRLRQGRRMFRIQQRRNYRNS